MKTKQQIQEKLNRTKVELETTLKEVGGFAFLPDVDYAISEIENEIKLLEWVLDLDNTK